MRQRQIVLGITLGLCAVAAPATAAELWVEGLRPEHALSAPGRQGSLLVNEQLFLQLLREPGSWSPDSTALRLVFDRQRVELRRGSQDLEWADGEWRFDEAMMLRGEDFVLVARAGLLRIDGDRARLSAPEQLYDPRQLRGTRGWLLAGAMGAIVAALYFRANVARRRLAAAPSARRRRFASTRD